MTLAGTLRDVMGGLDKELPLTDTVTMAHVVSEAQAGPRFAARLFGAFALVALLLAALGLYGLLAYSVSRRTREIGVRVALGAQRNHVRLLLLGEGMALTGAGIAIGLVGSVGATRLIASLLYGVRPADPEVFVLAPVLLATASIAACLLPVERATRVDPAVALRSE
jgi:putative ABC transport system permease protein